MNQDHDVFASQRLPPTLEIHERRRVTAHGTAGKRSPRYGVEEYVADNIIILRYSLTQERRRRTIETLKLCGARHGAREYPCSRRSISMTTSR